MDKEKYNDLLQQEKDRHQREKNKQDKDRNKENERHQRNKEYLKSLKNSNNALARLEAKIEIYDKEVLLLIEKLQNTINLATKK